MEMLKPNKNTLAAIDRTELGYQERLSRMIGIGVTLMLIGFCVRDIIIGSHVVAVALAVFATINLCALIFLRRTSNLSTFTYYLLVSGGILVAYLVASGGTNNSGIIWLSSYPVLAFTIICGRTALCACLVLAAVTAITLFFEPVFYVASYNNHLKSVAYSAFIFSCIISFIHSQMRSRTAQEVKALTQMLNHLATSDELTGLANRREMNNALLQEYERWQRNHRPFTIALFDIDHFKYVNDNFGHYTGDRVLKQFAAIALQSFRKIDKVARWGGEEFMVLLPDTDLEQAQELANRFRTTIQESDVVGVSPSHFITVSAGLATADGQDVMTMIKQADTRLYQAKADGRNRVNV